MTAKPIWPAAVLWICGACGPGRVRPDDQSAQAHREEAARVQAEADAHGKQYDPSQTRTHTVGGRAGVVDAHESTYNPTDWHLHESQRLSAHARAHQEAAAQLEKFEAEECRAFSPRVRAVCPVAGPIARMEDIPGGVRFVLADGAPVESVVAHMRCHFAWARTRGFANVPGCPIYIKGIDIHQTADGHAVDVTAHEAGVVTELRKRSHDEGAGT